MLTSLTFCSSRLCSKVIDGPVGFDLDMVDYLLWQPEHTRTGIYSNGYVVGATAYIIRTLGAEVGSRPLVVKTQASRQQDSLKLYW